MVVTDAFVTFPFVDVDDGRVLELLRNSPAVPDVAEELYKALRKVAAVVSSSVGRCASSSMSGRCAMLSIAACEKHDIIINPAAFLAVSADLRTITFLAAVWRALRPKQYAGTAERRYFFTCPCCFVVLVVLFICTTSIHKR